MGMTAVNVRYAAFMKRARAPAASGVGLLRRTRRAPVSSLCAFLWKHGSLLPYFVTFQTSLSAPSSRHRLSPTRTASPRVRGV